MGLGIAVIQNLLELKKLGFLKNINNVIELGSQELYLQASDLKELVKSANLDVDQINNIKNIDNWPKKPWSSSKEFYDFLGIKSYQSIDLNGEHNAINHDLNLPFLDKQKFNSFDLVTDFGTAKHTFNISECYKLMHNLAKKDSLLIYTGQTLRGSGNYLIDKRLFETIALANNYKIIYSSYIIHLNAFTENQSEKQFHIPLSKDLFEAIDHKSIRNINIYMVFQKQNNEEFKIPYEGKLMLKQFDTSVGFNRLYHKDSLSYSYIVSSSNKILKIFLSNYF